MEYIKKIIRIIIWYILKNHANNNMEYIKKLKL